MQETPEPAGVVQLEELLQNLKQFPDAGYKMLDLATALANRGRLKEAAMAELAALDLADPAVTHSWRRAQARRAPANQFLLINDATRTEAFRRALADCVSPGDLVLEIGTGSGILAILAAQAGAAQVVSCERQALMARIARDIVRDNHLEDSVKVIAKGISELELGEDLPDKANIVVADLFTGALLEAGGLGLIQHARKTLARPDALVIPATASLRGRLVGGSELERLCRAPNSGDLSLSGFNLFSPPVVQLLPERFSELNYQAMSDVHDCFQFDFNTLEGFEPRRRHVGMRATGNGSVLGFLQWLRLELSPGNIMESDETSRTTWSRYLHVFPQSINVRAGDEIQLHIEHDKTHFSVWPI